MLHKYDHIKQKRIRSWRRFQQDRVVRNRIKSNDNIFGWQFNDHDDGDIDYGRCVWTDLLAIKYAFKSRTSFSHKKSKWWYHGKEYNRNKYRYETKRCLWEEGIIERIGTR